MLDEIFVDNDRRAEPTHIQFAFQAADRESVVSDLANTHHLAFVLDPDGNNIEDRSRD